METGPHHGLCFGSCGMECMGLGDGGWDTLCSTRPLLQSSRLRITLRFSNNQRRSLPGKHALSNAEHCVLTVTPPPPPKQNTTWAQGFLVWRSSEISGIQMLYVNSFDSWLNFTWPKNTLTAAVCWKLRGLKQLYYTRFSTCKCPSVLVRASKLLRWLEWNCTSGAQTTFNGCSRAQVSMKHRTTLYQE